MKKGNFKQAVQIGRDVTAIMKLPCIHGVFKNDDGKLLYRPTLSTHSDRAIAIESDWICEDYDGNWHVVSASEYER